MSIRDAIRERLLTEVKDPAFTDVYETGMADVNAEKPFAVVVAGGETDSNDWRGFIQTYAVWPMMKRETFSNVDKVAIQIIEALNKPMTTAEGKTFTCVYDGSSSDDVYLDDWDAITRQLNFSVYAAASESGTGEPLEDEWLNALSNWTKATLGEEWAVYTGYLPPDYKRPAVLWDITDVGIHTTKTSGFVGARKTFVGYVLANDKTQRLQAVWAVTLGLRESVKIPLSEPENTWLTVDIDTGNIEQDGVEGRQLNVVLWRNERIPRKQYPLMMKVEGTGIIRE